MSKLLKIALNTSRSMAIPIFNFLIAMIGVSYLGKAFWGEMVQLLLWIYFIAFLTNFGNKDYLLRSYSENPSKINTLFGTVLFTRSVFLIFSLLFFFFFPVEIALWSLLLTIFIFLYQSLESLVIYKQTFLVQLIAEIIGFTIITITLIYTENLQIETLLKIYSLSFFIKLIIVLSSLKIDYSQVKFQFSKDSLLKLTPFFLIGFSGWLVSKIDLYLVTIFLPKEQLASYQLLITAFLMIQAFAGFIMYPFSKHIYRLNNKSIKKIKQILQLASIPIIGVSTFIIWYVFEQKIQLNLQTELYYLGAILSVPVYFYIVDVFQLFKNGKENTIMKINFTIALLNLILIVFLVQLFKLKGVLISMIISQFTLLILYKRSAVITNGNLKKIK